MDRIRNLERLLLLPAFAPAPNQFNPKIQAVGGNINLSGRNFNVSAPQVQFVNTATNVTVPATVVGLPTSNQLTVQVPAGAATGMRLRVTTEGGQVTSDDTFQLL